MVDLIFKIGGSVMICLFGAALIYVILSEDDRHG